MAASMPGLGPLAEPNIQGSGSTTTSVRTEHVVMEEAGQESFCPLPTRGK